MYRTAGFVADRTEPTLWKGLDEVLRIYNHCGYKIETIHCDNEFRPFFAIDLQKGRKQHKFKIFVHPVAGL